MAHVEAVIDFASEDEHISGEVEKSVVPRVRSLRCVGMPIIHAIAQIWQSSYIRTPCRRPTWRAFAGRCQSGDHRTP